MPHTDRHTHKARPGILTAALALRFGGRRVDARVCWPQSQAPRTGSPLIFVPSLAAAANPDPLCRLLCSAAAGVVVALPCPPDTDHDHELEALGWAVDHGAELGAQPEHLMVAGEGAGGARAACLAIRARDDRWPPLHRQILLHPTFTQTCPMPSMLIGVAPATVISSDTRIDDGSAYAAQLRASDIEVSELCYPPPILPGHDDFAAALARRTG